MILQKLPQPGSPFQTDKNILPFFPDHYLFTEEIHQSYKYPDHITAFGIVSALKGNGDLRLNGETKKINETSFLVVNSGSRLAISEMLSGTRPAFLFFNSRLTGIAISSLIFSDEKLLDNFDAGHQFEFSFLERIHSKNSSLHTDLLLLIQLGNSCSSFAALKADIIIRTILEELIIQNCSAIQMASALSVIKKSTRLELFRRLSCTKEWIENNYASPVTLNDMAKTAMMNSQHFLRKFKECYKITPHQFLIDIRLANAKKMLADKNETVSDICNNCGFESLSSFSWLFSQKFGISPLQFRKNIH